MSIVGLYKTIIPATLRNYVAGIPRVQAWRNRQLVKEGERLAAQIRTTRSSDGKIHVALLETRRGFWLNHASIYEAMVGDKDFDPHVFVVPKRSPAGDYDWDEYSRLISFFDSKRIPCHWAYDLSSRSWNNPIRFDLPDVVFLSQPYDYQQNFMYGSLYWSHFSKVAFLDYGLSIDSSPSVYNAPSLKNCAFLFAESEIQRKIFANYSSEHEKKLVVTGHPLLDSYLRPLKKEQYIPFKSPKSTRRIVWAPHFTVSAGKTEYHFSNFFSYFETFVRLAEEYPELEIVMRPHPALFNFMVNSGMKTVQEAQEYRIRFETLPNGRIYDDADYISLFRQSDAMVLDSISFIGSYAPTGNPVCFLESPGRARLNSIGERLLHADYAAWDETEIRDFVEQVVLAGQDPRRQEREASVRKLLFMPPEGAGVRISRELKARLSP